MGRQVQAFSTSEKTPTMVLLSYTGVAGETKDFEFTNGSIIYFEYTLKNAFDYSLVENVGYGKVRLSYNRPYLSLENYTNGGKIESLGYDGSSETWLTMSLMFETPILLQSSLEDYAEITIADSLNGLTRLRCMARGAIEYKIENGVNQINAY